MTKSNCCNAATTVRGNTTHYYTCNECGKACDGDKLPTEQHVFPEPHFDEGCTKCGGFDGEPCEPP
ncbi:hypothetical protein KDA08_05815, partial [Candidatus Saccharibacteria bacterium]|nr:hypothetical protein [Candidatus Saccharibacteria bacterium]